MTFRNLSIVVLRITLGWMFLYSGVTKFLDPTWSAAGYLQGATSFGGLYHWFTQPGILPFVNTLNEWGQILLGISLILGIGVRLSSFLGVGLMALYYLPLGFPRPDTHSFIVDDHVIFAAALLVMASLHVGRVFGLERWCSNLPICSRFPKLRWFIG